MVFIIGLHKESNEIVMYIHVCVCVCTYCRHVEVAEMNAMDYDCSITLQGKAAEFSHLPMFGLSA